MKPEFNFSCQLFLQNEGGGETFKVPLIKSTAKFVLVKCHQVAGAVIEYGD